jgi:DNA-binding transcriptional LysR family regulator
LRVADLSAYCAVAERRSFVDAARSLGTTPSTVTRAVQSIEALVGEELINRTQRFTSLTPAGEAFYDVAKGVVNLLKDGTDALSKNSGAVSGWVRFSASAILETHFLPEVLLDLTKAHPELKVDVTYTDESVNPAEAGLDFAIRGAYPVDSNLIGQTLWTYDRYLVASSRYIEKYGAVDHPRALNTHRIIMHTGPRILKDWHLKGLNESVRVKVDPTHRVSTGSGLLAFTLQGMGIARMASWVAEPLIACGQLVRVCPDYVVISSTGRRAEMHAVYQSSALSRRARSVLKFVRQRAAQAFR